jgi:hypothetical protein
MAEVEKNSLQQLIDWVFSWKEPFEWLRQRIGLLLTVVVILSAVAVVAAVLHLAELARRSEASRSSVDRRPLQAARTPKGLS